MNRMVEVIKRETKINSLIAGVWLYGIVMGFRYKGKSAVKSIKNVIPFIWTCIGAMMVYTSGLMVGLADLAS